MEFTREQRIINALMNRAYSIDDIGLLHGKMGIVLYFFHLGRAKDNNVFTVFAEELLDNVIEPFHESLPIDFKKGITGIAWAVEYLIRNGFIDADADDMLREVDERVFEVLLYKRNNMEEVLSMLYYLIGRISYRIDEHVEEIRYNISLLIELLEREIASKGVNQEVAYVLDELSKLNIFNENIGKLEKISDSLTSDFIFPKILRYTREQLNELMSSKSENTEYAGFELSHISESKRFGLESGIAGIGLQHILLK